MRDDITWEMNEKRIRDLWPTAMYPPDLKDLIKRRLSRVNQQWLKEALEEVKSKYASHQPELKWFLQEYERIESRWHRSQPAVTVRRPTIVDHTRMRNGTVYEVSAVFQSHEEAVEFAKTVNGTIRGKRNAPSDAELRAQVKALDREKIKIAIDWLRERRWIGDQQVSGDIDSWSIMLLGSVAGAVDVTSKALPQPAAMV